MANAEAAPRMTEDEMYGLVLASDGRYDGQFFFGVVTTGVFCRPSCRVRKPLRRNVRFFGDMDAAKAAGLRPCRRCRPDDLITDAEAAEEEVVALLNEVRTAPTEFPDVQALVERSGYGSTRLFAMFRTVLGLTPGEAMTRARLGFARERLLTTNASVLDIAFDAGFRSLSVFHRRFKAETGMTPRSYRCRYKEVA